MDDFFKNNPNLFGNNLNINNRNIRTPNIRDNNNSTIEQKSKFNTNNKNNFNNNNPYDCNRNQMFSRNSTKNIKDYNENKQNKQKPFIIGKFGKKTVVSQDLNTFINKMKKAEWTTNPSYLIAKDINITPTFEKSDKKENSYDIPRYSSTVDKLYLHLIPINFNDYMNYINEIKNRKNKLKEEAKKEKEDFLRNNFPNEGKLDLKSILNRIRNNHEGFISKDQILYNKIYQPMNY